MGVPIRQAEGMPGLDYGLHKVPGHSGHYVLWLSDNFHHACARQCYAQSDVMGHDQRMSLIYSLAESIMLIQLPGLF